MSKTNKVQKEIDKNLTKKQRRDRNNGEDIYIEPTAEEIAVASNKRKSLLLLVIIFAVVIMAAAIFVPVYYFGNYYNEDNPIVKINLDNGMTLTYKLYVEDSPISATNFLFLAEMGYFDGNIVHDSSGGWMRFGGYYFDEDEELSHRTADQDFIDSTSSYFTEHAGDDDQFSYNLYRDTSAIATYNDEVAKYGLFGNYTSYCNDFSILGEVGSSTRIIKTTGTTVTTYPLYMGVAYNDETKDNIDEIFAMEQNEEYYRSAFQAPLDDGEIISIKNVEVFNYTATWEDSYEDYLKGLDGSDNKISTYWTGTYI